MWNEILVGVGGFVTFNVLMYNVGRWAVRKEAQYSIIQLNEQKEMLEKSTQTRLKLQELKEVETLITDIETHFKNFDLNT